MSLKTVATYGNLHFAKRNTSGDAMELDFSTDIIGNLKIEYPSGNISTDKVLEDMY